MYPNIFYKISEPFNPIINWYVKTVKDKEDTKYVVGSSEMMKMMSSIFALFLVVSSINGECPHMEEIPCMYSEEAFSCFQYWNSEGGQYPINSCNGDTHLLGDGVDHDSGEGKHTPMGSIFVKPGKFAVSSSSLSPSFYRLHFVHVVWGRL